MSPEPEPAAGPALLRLQAVDQSYPNGTQALRGLSFSVARGEFVSLLGPSGCGKSTALRLIAGLARPSAGRIDWSEASGEIGFVFQEPTLMPWATVFDNVYLPLRLRGRRRADARGEVTEALERVGLGSFAAVYPRELSGGMKMRVSIARALVTRPRVLLLDEPFAALDEITRFKLNQDLLELWATLGWTVLFVTHSVFESAFLAQRVLVMTARPGRVFAALAVPCAHPRSESFRTSAEYAQCCRAVSELLDGAMRAGDD